MREQNIVIDEKEKTHNKCASNQTGHAETLRSYIEPEMQSARVLAPET